MARKQIRVWVPKRNKTHLGSLSGRMLFTWFMLTAFIFLFAPQGLTNKFQFAFVRIFRWPLSIGRNVSLLARTRQPPADVVSRKEFNKLQNLLADVIEQRDQEHKEVEKLSGLRKRFPLEGAKLLSADIITAAIDKLHSELIIDRGQNDGLARDQFVLADNSIIGTISDVDSRTARVRLFTDSASNMAVKIGKLNIERIMQGSGDNVARIEMIKHKVKIGSEIMAGKKPGFLDNPMIAGRVARCERNAESPLLWDITVEPVCDIERLNDVTVIVMNP
jgi:rod shape-determining protein MreC